MSHSEGTERIYRLKKSEDPFIIIRKIVCDFGYLPITKSLNKICVLFHLVMFSLQIYYLFSNFTLDLVVNYAPGLLASVYLFTCIVCNDIVDPKIIELLELYYSNAWSIKNVASERRSLIVKKMRRFYYFIIFCMTLVPVIGISMTPIVGDISDLCLCIQMFDEYFGDWSKIASAFYFSTLPYVAYSGVRLCYALLYSILHLQYQIAIINESIFDISQKYEFMTDERKRKWLVYQKAVTKRLKLIIEYHVNLKKIVKKLINFINKFFPVFGVLGVLTTLATMLAFQKWNSFNAISRFRVGLMTVQNVLIAILYCEAGQIFTNETGEIFNQLINCPWYIWNSKNKQVLLIFMANSLKPMQFSFARFVLERRLFLSIINTSCSYALFFYNLRKID